MLKIYLYGYLNRIQSTRRLEQEARRNLELMWLVGRLAPDFKTLAEQGGPAAGSDRHAEGGDGAAEGVEAAHGGIA